MTASDTAVDTPPQEPPRPREMNLREAARWLWRQLTSMRTALILLLLLAIAAVPGSLIPQDNVDGIKATNWKNAHPTLTPIYDKIGLFDVYATPWFAAIYILLMVSLVGCIVPRLVVYVRHIRTEPPAAPRRLTRLPDSTSYRTDESPDEVLDRARAVLKKRGYRLRTTPQEGAVSSERGYLREVGNLLFHLSILIVLVGFATGSLFGYKGGVITMVGEEYGFANELTQYDDFAPGSMFSSDQLDDFSFSIDDFDVEWLTSGPRQGMAQKFVANLNYQVGDDEPQEYDLRVNHPLDIDGTEVFLIGHGYAPVITVRDGNGDVAYSGPTVFLPENETFQSFGVIKAAYAEPEGIGINGFFYPSIISTEDGQFANIKGDIGDGTNSMLTLQVWEGDLNLDGGPQSAYQLDTSKAKMVTTGDGQPFNLRMGEKVELPDGLGTVSFDGIERWNRLQISQQPGKLVALAGVSLALLGLLGSLFIRSRRVWVRARRDTSSDGGGTLVEVAALDRSGGGDTGDVLTALVADLRGTSEKEES